MARNKTPIEQPIEPESLKKNFNIVSTSIDNESEFGERFLHSKHWTEKILKISFALIIASIIMFCLGVLAFVSKPIPAVYATTEYGALYELDRFNRDDALRAIEQHANPNNVESNSSNPNINPNINFDNQNGKTSPNGPSSGDAQKQ